MAPKRSLPGSPATFDPRARSLAIIPSDKWLASELRRVGVEPLIMPAHGTMELRYLGKLRALIREHCVKLIQTHLLGSGVYGSLAGLTTGVPVVAVFHGPTDLRNRGRFASLKRRLLLRTAAAIVAVSDSTRQELVELRPSGRGAHPDQQRDRHERSLFPVPTPRSAPACSCGRRTFSSARSATSACP